MHTRQRGTAVEARVLEFLLGRGYTFLDQNFTRRFGEIDLVVLAPDKTTIVFVEVRFRRRTEFGTAVDSVDQVKRRKLGVTALAWLQQNGACDRLTRFDVIGVQPVGPTDGPAYALDWVQDAIEF